MGVAAAGLRFDGVERVQLDERSWVDVVRGYVLDAAAVYEELAALASWRQGRLFRYEKHVDEPRLSTWLPPGAAGVPPVLTDVHRSLQHRYGVRLEGASAVWYRDGRDSMALHRDRDMRWLEDTIVAIVSVGARRPFLLRPRSQRYDHSAPLGGATHDLAPGAGDLLVMGGGAQAGWEHGVPKAPGLREGRISLQWRWTSRRGRPEVGASYRAPRTFSR